MKTTNRLTMSFLRQHPQDAAHVLEQLPLDMRASLFNAIPPEVAARVLQHFLPAVAAETIKAIDPAQAAQSLTHSPVASAARMLAVMDPLDSPQIMKKMPAHVRQRLRQSLRYPADTAGAIMETDYFVLPKDIMVGEAIKRLERSDKTLSGEIYVIGPSLQLAGVTDFDTLFKADRQVLLRAIMNRRAASVPVHARITNLPAHQAWQQVRSLPVVDAMGAVTGILHYPTLLQRVGEAAADKPAADAFGSMLSIAGLYWIAIAQLIDAVMVSRTRKPSQTTGEGS